MPFEYSIRVEHWNDFENKIFPQKLGSSVPKYQLKYFDTRNLRTPLTVWLDGASPGWTLAEITTTFLDSENLKARFPAPGNKL